jgi:H+-transporting ATPase
VSVGDTQKIRAEYRPQDDRRRDRPVFMTPLGWGYAALVWGYALIWFLLTDRIKLVAYRILDPVKNQSTNEEAVVSTEGPAASPSDADATATVAPFHTDTDPDDPVYHDNIDCPYGRAIRQHANDKSGQDGRRRCDWCTEHADHPVPLPAGAPKL